MFDCKKFKKGGDYFLSFQSDIKATKDNSRERACNHKTFFIPIAPDAGFFVFLEAAAGGKHRRWMIPAALIIPSHPQECWECWPGH